MTKEQWIKEANEYLVNITGPWENGLSIDYCESLYQDYVEEDDSGFWSPSDAVDEDMTYWD